MTGVLAAADEQRGGVRMTLNANRKRVSAALGVNNRASRAVGREQVFARLSAHGLITGADQLAFAGLQSVDLDELTVLSAKYETLINSEGLLAGVAATRSEAAPGIPFLRNLGFETEGWTASAYAAYPLILNRDQNLSLNAKASWKEFKSAFDVSPNTLDVLWTTSFGAAYTFSDRYNAQNKLGIELVRGWDIFDATEAGSPLASRAGAGGEFLALVADLSRIQKVTESVDMVLAIKAQTANNPLLSSEQCGFGGAGFGRAYDPFEISGDRCIVGLLEIRADPDFLNFGKLRFRPFASIDAGAVRQIGPLAAGETRTGSLYSLSAGVRAAITKHVDASFEGAVPLKGVVSQEGDDDPRFFFKIEARY